MSAPEVVQPGLEVVTNRPPVYKDYTPMPQINDQKGAYIPTEVTSVEGKDASDGNEKSGRTVLGMRNSTFCLLLALILVTLIAAIGGGVGGTMAVNNAKKNADA